MRFEAAFVLARAGSAITRAAWKDSRTHVRIFIAPNPEICVFFNGVHRADWKPDVVDLLAEDWNTWEKRDHIPANSRGQVLRASGNRIVG